MNDQLDRIGERLGNYRLTRLLGEGGFAEVYLGEHVHLNTQAAIKVLHTRLTSHDIEAFRTEARTIARLIHPHIVRVLDFGVEGKTPFLVMDYATSGTTRQRYPKGQILPLETIISYVRQVAEALQYAHDEKLIHRDIKPENMLLDQAQHVLLSDFGIAAAAQSSHHESAQAVIGTVAYMAPEQIQGRPRPASDQYALGVVVYEWLCGERPFKGSFTELCTQHMFARPPSLRARRSPVSAAIEDVVMTALRKDPARRFASVREFASALEQVSQLAPQTPSLLFAEPEKPRIFDEPFPARWEEQAEVEVEVEVPVPPTLTTISNPLTDRSTPFDTVPDIDMVYGSNRATVIATRDVERRKRPSLATLVIAALSLVLIVALTGGGSFYYFAAIYQPDHLRLATAQAQESATADASMTAATQMAIYHRATSGAPVLTDPLTAQNANNWDVMTYTGGGGCAFSDGAYHVTIPQRGYFAECMAQSTSFRDFAFEVDMTVITGNGGGLVFRTNDRGGTYRFRVDTDGYFDLVNQNPGNGPITSSSTLIHRGLKQTNVLTVVVRGSDISLYVNRQFLYHVRDNASSYGQIGLFAIDASMPTDVVFHNLKVWKL